MSRFSEFLHEQRIATGLTLRQFCETYGLDPLTMSEMERGVTFASSTYADELVEKVSDALGYVKYTLSWCTLHDLYHEATSNRAEAENEALPPGIQAWRITIDQEPWWRVSYQGWERIGVDLDPLIEEAIRAAHPSDPTLIIPSGPQAQSIYDYVRTANSADEPAVEKKIPTPSPPVHQFYEGNGSVLLRLLSQQENERKEVERHIRSHYSAAMKAAEAGNLNEALSHCVAYTPNRGNQMPDEREYAHQMGLISARQIQAAYDEAHTEEEPMDKKALHPLTMHFLKYFEYTHLPPELQEVSKLFHDLAWKIAMDVPQFPEVIKGERRHMSHTYAIKEIPDDDDGAAQSHVFFHAQDSPEANGRLPQAGDVSYTLTFTLDDGRTLVVYVGQTGLDAFKGMLRELAVDDALDNALGEHT